jgi:5'-nucleotidase
MPQKPVILLTNDDGIQSPGLWAVAETLSEIGYVQVVAPREQQSGMGRSLPAFSEGRIYQEEMEVLGKTWTVYAVDGTPAQAVQHGLLELSDEAMPSLVVAGINYGENIGDGVTISGTVGAALEAAGFGLPALAISRQTPIEQHHNYPEVDFSTSAYFAAYFAKWLLDNRRPDDVDVLKVDVPEHATPKTPWRITRLSRRRVFWPTRPERRALSDSGKLGYEFKIDPSKAEPDSDVYAVLHDGVVSVTPLSLDMTSRTDMFRLWQMLQSA